MEDRIMRIVELTDETKKTICLKAFLKEKPKQLWTV